MLAQLDPNRSGITTVVAKCTPQTDKDQKVHSLRETAGRGTPPWPTDLEKHSVLLGAESLAGYTVATGHPATIQNINEGKSLLPTYSTEFAISQTAYPILRSGDIAGCMVISSTQPHYFTPVRLALVADYAALLNIAFDEADFYPLTDIDLRIMPSYELQESYLASFRSRVAEVMLEMTRKPKPVNFHQAEEMVWQQIEQELLDLAQESLHKSG